ncbi:MAG TPA: LLM class F420-dependent oxidoreductase [Acidimicrobiales bacterium]|jgi:probable F420-dependent oxidoreductase|nr:LLM class F420-dependent oxidoreductase [Acidimicrobiales bacterium]
MTRVGVAFPDRSVTLASQRPRIPQLAALGYTDLWVGESDGADAVTPLALAAGTAAPLRLGTAIMSVFTRPPALLAMTAASLAEAATDGFVLGLGTSSPAIVERWNDLGFDRPLRRTRDVVAFLRAAFTGARVRERYATFAVDGFALARRPDPPPPIYLAALRPPTLELAAEIGDGVILTSLSANDLARMRPYLAPGKEVVAWITVCPCTDTERVREVARTRLAGYLAVPSYAALHEWLGRGESLAPMRDALSRGAGLAAAAAAIPDEVVDALVVHGTPAECHAHLDRYVAGGVTTPLIEVLPGVMDVGEALRVLAPRDAAAS